MSDSFADLWNSAAPPSEPSSKPRKLGSPLVQSNPSYTRNTQNDLFSQLSSQGSSASNSRSATPSSAPSLLSQKNLTKYNSNGDAFSGLFAAGSSLAGNRSTANMTIAERAAQAEKERLQRSLQQRQASSSTSSAWTGLDSLGSKTFVTSSTISPPAPAEDDWGLGVPEVARPAASSSNSQVEDDWGLADFANSPAPSHTSTTKLKPSSAGAFWDMEELSALGSQSQSIGLGKGVESTSSADHTDDILGDLSRPIEAIQRERHEKNQTAMESSQSPFLNSHASRLSPDRDSPHILGQLVEMGFSVTQAQAALASTDSGQDVQAALEILISNGAAGGGEGDDGEGRSFTRGKTRDQRTPSPLEEPMLRPRRDRQIAQQRQRESERERSRSSPSEPAGLQADKILAQASEIGFSLFNRANAAWKEGKERVQKVYEEKVAANAEGSNSRRGSGRSTPIATKPKWMQDSEGSAGLVMEQKGRLIEESSVSRGRPEDVDLFTDTSESSPSHTTKQTNNDAAGRSNGVYVSKFRHAKQKLSNPTPVSTSPAHPITGVSASPTTIAQSQESKASGTHFFKLGDFPAADTAYTRAIEVLPAGHALLIPLYNNRALIRLKVGDVQGVIADTKQVEELIGGVGSVREELKKKDRGKISVKGMNQGSGDDEVVNIPDALVKAWKRRAEALEGREKWEDAGKDWEKVACAEWTSQSVRAEGASAARRCRVMQQQGYAQSAPKSQSQLPIRPPPPRGPTPPSRALGSLRAANEAVELEDLQRYALKDSVEARLQTWKGGKENNIRALLASLDTILWPQSGVQKLSMAELISEGQVKVKYMKSIAKVHPDKLNAGNSTLEQRMIAAGVFSALNEAWNATKT
ncbi:hypothetical protein GGU10DRAFT_308639 [Lentinula aff. detonsa]|uniref:UBA domain-containing protein n=1 Tax=Lentinula aff. detonsa TaxID=2804958 RepID=A0AA38L5M3_9AGAR|nr:hypothetical protein GGU10DRAFT_308639 [Lentinula aff. detonsa]